MVIAYQAIYQTDRKENAYDITGSFTVGTHSDDGGKYYYYGPSWTGSNQSERELDSDPVGVVTGLYYNTNGTTTIDISIDMKTIISSFPVDMSANGNAGHSDKGLTITLSNGKTYTFKDYYFRDDGGGKHYQFYVFNSSDILDLQGSNGKNLTFKITW